MLNKDQILLEQAYQKVCKSGMLNEDNSRPLEAYILDAIIKKTSSKEHNDIILMLLKKCIRLYSKIDCRVHETDDKFTFRMNVDLEPGKSEKFQMKDQESLFFAFYGQEYDHYMKRMKEKQPKFKPYTFPKVELKWANAKYQELRDRLPELEGIF